MTLLLLADNVVKVIQLVVDLFQEQFEKAKTELLQVNRDEVRFQLSNT